MRYVIFVLVLTFTAACKKETTQNNTDQNGSEMCYVFQRDSSEVFLRFTNNSNEISGSLLYAFKEKDRNTGTISGEWHGDTLFAKYTFMSEGIEGQRDVVFLKSGDSFIEGRGKLDEQTGNLDLSDKSQITFAGGLVLLKTDCGSIENK